MIETGRGRTKGWESLECLLSGAIADLFVTIALITADCPVWEEAGGWRESSVHWSGAIILNNISEIYSRKIWLFLSQIAGNYRINVCLLRSDDVSPKVRFSHLGTQCLLLTLVNRGGDIIAVHWRTHGCILMATDASQANWFQIRYREIWKVNKYPVLL